MVVPIPKRAATVPLLERTPKELDESVGEYSLSINEDSPLSNVVEVENEGTSCIACTEDTEQKIATEAALFSPDGGANIQVRLPVGSISSRPPWALQCESPEPDIKQAIAPADMDNQVELLRTWTPAPDAWTVNNPMPLERWDVSGDHVERVHYNARSCNWKRPEAADQLPKLVFSSFTGGGTNTPFPEIILSDIDKEPSNVSSSSSEEGEIDDRASPPESRFRSHVDELRIPTFASLRRGALITRKYLSSPSTALSESTADIPVYDQLHEPTAKAIVVSPSDDNAATTECLAEAERLINAAVHSVTIGTANSALRPRAESFFDLPSESSGVDPLFHFEPDSDSLPELVEASSSESSGTSDLDRLNLEGATEVFTSDCVDAIHRMRQSAPSPDVDSYHRTSAQTRLLNWGRQQESLLERLRDDENRHAILPLQQSLDIVYRYLNALIDRRTTAVGTGGIPIPDESRVRVYLDDVAGADEGLQTISAERALDLVTHRVGAGKCKIRDEMAIIISGDGKRQRRLGGSAWACTPASRAAIQAEAARLRVFLIPLIDIRGHILDFLSRILVLSTRRRYVLDMSSVEQNSEASFPLLKWEEHAQLRILRKAFNDKGQTVVVNAMDAILNLQFRDAHVLEHLLHYEILSLEEYSPPGDAADDLAAAKVFERACFDQRYPMPVSNQFMRQMTPPGRHVPGPLFCVLPTPAWLTNNSRGRDSRSISPSSGRFRREGSVGASVPFRIYDESGYYVSRPVVRSPIPVPFKSRRMD